MNYKDIEDLQRLLDRDIRGVIAKGDISPQDYQCLDVAIDISKDLHEIATMIPMMPQDNDGYEYGYNRNTYDSNPNMSNGNGNTGVYYDNRYRPRMRNTGHMSMEDKLGKMMQEASSEQERQIISKLMKNMETM